MKACITNTGCLGIENSQRAPLSIFKTKIYQRSLMGEIFSERHYNVNTIHTTHEMVTRPSNISV